MKQYRIRIEDASQRAHGILEITKRGRVVSLRGNQFIVPEPALTLLDELKVAYELLGEDDPEDALRSLRDSAATPR